MPIHKTVVWLSGMWLALLMAPLATAQFTEARVSSVSGAATLQRGGSLPLRKLDVLQLGDVIETGPNGRVVIALSDGSQVIVGANAHIVLKDFRQATSVRELLEIFAGRVRVKIHHLGQRPNPYRINSPVASIAVRGTEFDVSVAASGETEVRVFSGLVEVTSRLDQNQRRLIEPGRNVIVRATGDLVLNLPGSESELRGQAASLTEPALNANVYTTLFSVFSDALTAQERYLRNLLEPSLTHTPSRYAAFADSHFDSLGNPAYATEFQAAAGRVYLLPSLHAPLRVITRNTQASAEKTHPYDYTGGAQGSFFQPLGARSVIGGGVAWTRTQLESSARSEERLDGFTDQETWDGAVKQGTGNLLFSAARRLGTSERTSLGVSLEHLRGRTDLFTLQTVRQEFEGEVQNGRQLYEESATAGRTRFTLGLTHAFANGAKLGVFYRHGLGRATTRFHIETKNIGFDDPPLEQRRRASFHEVGGRWRARLSPHWLFGLETTWRNERIFQHQVAEQSLLNGQTIGWRGNVGGGFGWTPRPTTAFSFDVASGARGADRRWAFLDAEGKRQNFRADEVGQFFSMHLSAQTIWRRRLLASTSWLALHEWGVSDTPRLFNQYNQHISNHLSNFAAGWVMPRGWLVQYVFSINYQRPRAAHTLVWRYDFARE